MSGLPEGAAGRFGPMSTGNEVAGAAYEAVVDVREGGALQRMGDFAVGVLSAVLGDPTAGSADIVVRRRDDPTQELFRLESFDEDEVAQLVTEVREDLATLPFAEFVARWEPAEDHDEETDADVPGDTDRPQGPGA